MPASIEPDDDNRLGEGDRASFTASDLRMVSWREFRLAGFKEAHSCFVTMESTNPRTHSSCRSANEVQPKIIASDL